MQLDAKMPSGPLRDKWDRHGCELKLVNPANKLKHTIMAVSKQDWKQIGQDYGIKGIPTAVVIDQDGIVKLLKVGSGPANAKAIDTATQISQTIINLRS